MALPLVISYSFFFTALFITCHLILLLVHLSSIFPTKTQASRWQGLHLLHPQCPADGVAQVGIENYSEISK